jgi:glycosyltransferase involved in cell wall biosynthesis
MSCSNPKTPYPSEPLVSIGIPTYNRPTGLRRALECITRQSHTNLEIIISNNASPGNETDLIAKAFAESDTRIKYFRQPVNIGANRNFKFVLSQASGKYFLWFADDDFCDTKFVGELVGCLESDPEVALAMSDVRIIDEETSVAAEVRLESLRLDRVAEGWPGIRKLFFAYPTSNIFFCIYGIYRTEILKGCKIMVSRWKDMALASEVPILAQIASKGKIVSLSKVLKTYISHKNSMYVQERQRISWFDRLVRTIEIRVSLTAIAIASNINMKERACLSFYPWVSLLVSKARTLHNSWGSS